MEDEIQDKLEEIYNFRIDVKFKDFRQYEVYARIDNEKAFTISILYDAKSTLEANITNIRHKEALSDAYESLKLVKKSIEDEMPEDFLSIDLMNAYSSLGKIIGQEVEDDLVNEIFSKFCMGK